MKPIYFPFTCIFDLSAEIISAFFGQTVIYRPSSKNLSEMMQESVKRGVIDIRIPVKRDESELDAILKDYKSWLNLHLGDKRGACPRITFYKKQTPQNWSQIVEQTDFSESRSKSF